MKVSIAMATYNGEKYIQEQLDSFLAQTYLPDELIVTDDCSTDSTEQIVKAYAETAPFDVVFHRNEKNLGYCGNFNAALMKTTGDLVFLSDQDDVWFPEKMEFMVRLAEENPEMLVLMNDTELTDGELNPVGLTKLGQIKSAGLSLNSYVMGCCCAVRRELLDLCMPIPEGFRAHDNWLVEFAAGLNAKWVDKTVLQYYRRHESNESQFIVNRTVKVNRVDVFKERLSKVFEGKLNEAVDIQITQRRLFVDGVSRALERNPVARVEQINEMLQCTQLEIDCLVKRVDIRRLPLFSRIVGVVVFFLKGGYGLGAKSIVRDLLG
mgnify:CR=1 FL=1